MEQMREALDALLAAIRSSEEYKNYQDIKARIHEKPEVEKRVAEFRKRNYQLQNQKDADLFGEMDKLEREKSKICENSLAAELAFCRVIQEINWEFVEKLDFEVGFENEGE